MCLRPLGSGGAIGSSGVAVMSAVTSAANEQGGLQVRVHEALAAALAADGVDTMFGLIGDSNLFMVQAFVEQHDGRYVSAVHEAGAVMMAHGYACRSGRLGVATVTQGPGLSNTVTALIEAVRAGTPLLLVCGDTVPGSPANLQS